MLFKPTAQAVAVGQTVGVKNTVDLSELARVLLPTQVRVRQFKYSNLASAAFRSGPTVVARPENCGLSRSLLVGGIKGAAVFTERLFALQACTFATLRNVCRTL